MTRATIAGGALAFVLVLIALAVGYRALDRDVEPVGATSPEIPPSAAVVAAAHPGAASHQGFLYGRVTTVDGAAYEGRLRWGRDQEAFWGDLFNGAKRENPWLAQVPPERRPRERSSVGFLGIEIFRKERLIDVERPFVARCGDIARVEASGREVRVTLKSGTVFDLDRFEASDFDDGLRVGDGGRVVDLDSLRIRTVEFLPTPALGVAPYRLHGTVRTRQGGEFSGFVAWDRDDGVGTDTLDGRGPGGDVAVRYDTIRSIARRPDGGGGSLVTLVDGRELALAASGEAGDGNRGIDVDDRRYGRVLVSWDAFERAEFGTPVGGGSGPGYDDFPPGSPLTGSVTTRSGRRLAGRLVYDLDESETTDTLDAPSKGVDYTLPFGLIASIVPPKVTLHDGEELELEAAGDLGEGNAGMLVLADGAERPEHVPWADVERVDFDRPPAMGPAAR